MKLIIWILLLINSVYLIIINDIEYRDDTPRGQINVKFYLLYSNPLEYHIANRFQNGCDADDPFEIECDTVIYDRACTFTENSDDYLYNRVGIWRFNEPSFKVSMKRVMSDTYRFFLLCGNITETVLPDQTNKNDFRNKPWNISESILYYTKYLQITIDAGDRNQLLHGQRVKYLSYVNFAIFFSVRFNIMLQWSRYVTVKYMDSVYLLMFQENITCVSPPYYGSTCWYECTNDTRHTCVCDPIKSYQSLTCNITCLQGYYGRYVSYLVEDRRVLVRVCDIKNPCENNNCNKDICLPIDNISYFCEKVLYQFIYKVTSDPVPSDLFYINDEISLIIKFDAFSPEFLKKTKNVYIYFDKYNEIFKKVLKLHADGYSFTVLRTSEIDVQLNLTLGIFFQPWNILISRIKKFYVYGKPDKIGIYNANDSSPIGLYLLLGETIICKTSALPVYKTKFFWLSNVLVFNHPYEQLQYISPNYNLVDVEITCYVKLAIRLSVSFSNTVTIKVLLKIYKDFTWTILRDLILRSDEPECIAVSFIPYKLLVIQADGPDELFINSSKVTFGNATGGTYSFYCIFMSEGKLNHYFSRFITYNLRAFPNEICYHLYPIMYGSVIQCGHDGYIKDEFLIELDIYKIDNTELLVATNFIYTRIPFYISSPKYKVICIVSPIFSNLNISIESRQTIIYKVQGNYRITRAMQICAKEIPYVQNPLNEYHESNETTITLMYFAFNMLYISDIQVQLYLVLAISIYSILPLVIVYITILGTDSISILRLSRTAREIRHKLTRGRIYNRLEEVRRNLELVRDQGMNEIYRDSFLPKFFKESVEVM